MKFSEMRYERPDIARVIAQIEKITSDFTGAKDLAAAKAAFKEKEELFCHIETMASLCSARYSL
ncbi:MAG: M3 family oligoendopeptidase, partial [Firmicutes bacterium]|nr:M3 family oligoendopeptidase [Bacillota bacterium]